MNQLQKAGFTIVETMLFLGVSGLLIMGILVGTGTSINIQRYRDSVRSLQAVLQQQYSEVANVINDTSTNSCNAVSSPRGQSDCVVLGKFITIPTASNGGSITITNVIGTIPVGSTETNDAKIFQSYNIRAVTSTSVTYDVDWGSRIVDAGGNTAKPLSMLILRSPLSGVIHTFIKDTAPITNTSNIATLVAGNPPTTLSNDALLCVDSNSLFDGARIAVHINPGASGASAISIIGENSGC